MRKTLSFTDFINEKKEDDAFHKIFMWAFENPEIKFAPIREYAFENFFVKFNEENLKKFGTLPIFLYGNLRRDEEIADLMKAYEGKEEMIYNSDEDKKDTSNKKTFYELFPNAEWIPNTVYVYEDALEMKFPIIAKPTDGHSGLGILSFDSKEELQKEFENNKKFKEEFDLFSEKIEIQSEKRTIFFKEEPILTLERVPLDERTKTLKGNKDQEMNFKYVKVDNLLTENESAIISEIRTKSHSEIIALDTCQDENGKTWVIEANSSPGFMFDLLPLIYEKIYEDFYGTKVPEEKIEKFKTEITKISMDNNPNLQLS